MATVSRRKITGFHRTPHNQTELTQLPDPMHEKLRKQTHTHLHHKVIQHKRANLQIFFTKKCSEQ